MVLSSLTMMVLAAGATAKNDAADLCGPLPTDPQIPTVSTFQCPEGFTPEQLTEEGTTIVKCLNADLKEGDSLLIEGRNGSVDRAKGVTMSWENGKVVAFRADDKGQSVSVMKSPKGELLAVRRWNVAGDLLCARIIRNGKIVRRFDLTREGPKWTWFGADGKAITPQTPLEQQDIADGVAEGKEAIRRCYESELRSTPTLSGRLVLQWTIRNGEATELEVEEDELKRPAMLSCVKERITRLRFRPATEETTVSYPFVFNPSKTSAQK